MTSAAHDERRRILKMVQDGRITAEDAARLIGAIAASDTTAAGGPRGRDPMGGDAAPDPDLALAVLPPASPPAPGPTWLRVRVTDVATGDPQVDIKVPAGLVAVVGRIGAHLVPDGARIDVQGVLEDIGAGARGRIADIQDHAGGTRVELFLE